MSDDALAGLVRAHHPRVHRFGLRVCRDAPDADEAVQEAFAKLAVRPDVVDHPGALSWLMTVVRNACLRLLRPIARDRRVLGERTPEDAVPSDRIDAQQSLERWERARALHAAVARLDPPLREVLVMRDLEGCTGEETATALGLELATMKTRLHRARAALRRDLQALR